MAGERLGVMCMILDMVQGSRCMVSAACFPRVTLTPPRVLQWTLRADPVQDQRMDPMWGPVPHPMYGPAVPRNRALPHG